MTPSWNENLLTVDRTTLPQAMLDTAKAHLRVTHTRDDSLIAAYLAQAIDTVERQSNINVNPATFALQPPNAYPCPCVPYSSAGQPPGTARLPLPVNNVSAFTLVDGDGADQAASYSIEQADLGGSATSYLVGPAIPATTPTSAVIAQGGVVAGIAGPTR